MPFLSVAEVASQAVTSTEKTCFETLLPYFVVLLRAVKDEDTLSPLQGALRAHRKAGQSVSNSDRVVQV